MVELSSNNSTYWHHQMVSAQKAGPIEGESASHNQSFSPRWRSANNT